MSAIDLQLWEIRKRAGRRKPWELRWRVGANTHSKSFLTKALAQTHQAELIKAASVPGTEWDLATGEPASWGRKQATWFDHSLLFVKEHWNGTAAGTRRRKAANLADIAFAMIDDTARSRRTRPDDAILRIALKKWAYRPGRTDVEQPPAEIAAALAWLADHSRPVAYLAEDENVRKVMAQLGRLHDGSKAASGTLRGRRATFYQALDFAVRRKLIRVNLLNTIKTRRRHADDAVSPLVVPTLEQAGRIIATVPTLRYKPGHEHWGRMLHTFFTIMLYGGLRPSEVMALTAGNCHLPLRGWGKLTLTGAAPDVGALWTDTGERHEKKGLKHRAATAVRVVPIPPALVAILRDYLSDFDPAPDGRLFYDGPDHGYFRARHYQDVWRRARKAALSDAERASHVARRPYDLRHFNASTLIMAGVDAAQVARRLGHSVQTLMAVYVHWIDTGQDAANAKIEAALAGQTTPDRPVTSENATHGPTTGQPATDGPIAA
ncbi:tyrosine-type recombinase/integrase [Nonomuraea phyllanthi]|uniref:tyrosine-type recombinase/integrase n=1 Tax=Nonomuraea phyllanthi TaxID=2219224 RepID=UPI001292E5CD|nr:site-specific integrase [Nonomuraea phyllanthi]QFY06143.1 tyrosine-type recombinase/integrase [Nonomuraea phyllanthi]